MTRRLLAAVLAVMGVVVPRAAPAQQRPAEGFAVSRFEPAERGGGWFTQDHLDFRGGLRPAIGVVADAQYRPLVISRNDAVLASIVRNQVALHVGGSMVYDRFRGALSLPVAIVDDGHGGTSGGVRYDAPPRQTALGDLRLALHARLLGEPADAISLAAGFRVWVPTGSKAEYMGDGDVRVSPELLGAGARGPVGYAARLGYAYRGRTDAFGAAALGSEIVFGVSAGARLANGDVLVGPEIQGSSLANGDFLAPRATPILGLFGAHAALGDVHLGAGIGTGLSRGLGTPEVRGLVSIEWSPAIVTDRDLDGVLDKDDACVGVKGVETTDPRTNGCPPPPALPPPDSDGDGILDRNDECPDVAGDPELDGCPADRDRDGIPDKDDACPADPGMRTDDPRTNGCPDRDGDGVFDKDDACKDARGARSNDPAKNGCPDGDRDKDGVRDEVDACPDVAGERSADPTRNGCPRVELEKNQIRLAEPILFRGDTAILDGDDTLRGVLRILRTHPEIARVRIEAHTDNRGPADQLKRLTEDRAQVIVAWLQANGVDRGRLTGVGHGGAAPLFDNTTEDGRRRNRRVEIWVEAVAEVEPPGTGGRHKGGGKKR